MSNKLDHNRCYQTQFIFEWEYEDENLVSYTCFIKD